MQNKHDEAAAVKQLRRAFKTAAGVVRAERDAARGAAV
jgi:hypothetical protein